MDKNGIKKFKKHDPTTCHMPVKYKDTMVKKKCGKIYDADKNYKKGGV